MKKYFVVTQTTVVKAPNMIQAKLLALKEDANGIVLDSSIDVEESKEDDVLIHITDSDPDLYSINFEEMSNENIPFQSFNTENSISPVDFLRSENKRLSRLLDKHKIVKDEATNAVYQAAHDAFSDFSLPKVFKPTLTKLKATPETAVAVFADWQLGKVTPDYNSSVLEDRIELYTEKLFEITEIQRKHHNVDNLHVWLLGDIVEGEEIFPGQSHLIDSGLYRQVGINGPRVLSKFLYSALENFEHVHVTGVIGNHGSVGGRLRKLHDPETNMDRLLYKIVSLIFESNDRITFNIPDGRGERNFYAIDEIGDYKTLLIHGDQLPAPSSISSYKTKILSWKDGGIPEYFDDVFMGHYHQQFKMSLGSTILRISGSPESFNTYAQEYFFSMSRPSQQLMFIHPERGVTSEYTIWLD
jgi:hypothetical protein